MSATKNILITGADGQLGQELQLVLNSDSFRIFALNKSQLDIANKVAVNHFFRENNIDVAINCAAYTAVDKAESEAQNAMK
jgi:dTDP-4-dehydrorhamnose reductase